METGASSKELECQQLKSPSNEIHDLLLSHKPQAERNTLESILKKYMQEIDRQTEVNTPYRRIPNTAL